MKCPRIYVVWFTVIAILSCDFGAPNDVKKMPRLAPPPVDFIDPGIRIEVVVDGNSTSAITAQTLRNTPPDFSDEQRRAWRLDTLLGNVVKRPGTVIAVTGDRGIAVEFDTEQNPDQLVPVIMLSRRKEVVAMMVHPRTPFPAFHGQGRRLGRPGDPFPRVTNVTKIQFYVRPSE